MKWGSRTSRQPVRRVDATLGFQLQVYSKPKGYAGSLRGLERPVYTLRRLILALVVVAVQQEADGYQPDAIHIEQRNYIDHLMTTCYELELGSR